MTVSLIPPARLQFVDVDGSPLAGGSVATYQPGTFTPVTTYQDYQGTTANPNPTPLDSAGSAALWGSGNIRMVVTDTNGDLLYDAVTTCPASSVGYLLAANNLDDIASVATSRTNLGLGSAATASIGTSGTSVPLLSAANTWSGAQTFDAETTLVGGGITTPQTPPAINEVGYLGVPQTVKTANYQLAITDAGSEVFCGASLNVTIPPNATVAFPIGTIVDIVGDQTYTVAIVAGSGVTLRNPIGNTTGTRTITGPGTCTIKQEKLNEWWVRGSANLT